MTILYLYQKINVPKVQNVLCLSWSRNNWIAVGAEDSKLKVLKIDSEDNSMVSVNQALEGHSGDVIIVKWNNINNKLTTCDEKGMIIVWTLYKGTWYEEMVNNREISTVVGFEWNDDGSQICIAYEDGNVIMGSLEGSKLWSKELSVSVKHVTWFGKQILLASENQIYLYDGKGNYIRKAKEDSLNIKKIEYFNNASTDNSFCLAVAYENGTVKLLNKDFEGITLNVGNKIVDISFGVNILAVASNQTIEKELACVLHFYAKDGKQINSMKVPGHEIHSIHWESNGISLAIAVDSNVYFCRSRFDYQWGWMDGHSLVYTYSKPKRQDISLCFGNTKTGDINEKLMNNIHLLHANNSNCLVVLKEEKRNCYALNICNSIGSAIQSTNIDFTPFDSRITLNFAFVVSSSHLLYWRFRDEASSGIASIVKQRSVPKIVHVKQIQSLGITELAECREEAIDPIVSIDACDTHLLVAHSSGKVHQISLPECTWQSTFELDVCGKVYCNVNATYFILLDATGNAFLYDINAGKKTLLDVKDVWDCVWAQDDAMRFVLQEKTKLRVFSGLQELEVVQADGCVANKDLAAFKESRITLILMDQVVRSPEKISADIVVTIECQALKKLKELVETGDFQAALTFAENNSHNVLWKFIGEKALNAINLRVAEKAFIRCADYHGLHTVKHLEKLDASKKKATVLEYFGDFDEAEQVYLETNRKDLAIEMRIRIGDWFKAVQLLKSSVESGVDDAVMNNALESVGDYYFDRQRYAMAFPYFQQTKKYEKLADCYYKLENFEALAGIIASLPDRDPLLKALAGKFVSVGMSKEAINAFMKYGDIETAVNTCVYFNQWSTAFEIGTSTQNQQIQKMFSLQVESLLKKGRKDTVVELYKSANFCLKAAELMCEIANESEFSNDSLKKKKIYVLAGLEIERHRQLKKPDRKSSGLDAFLKETMETSTSLDSVWKRAEAYHFLLLAHVYFYKNEFVMAMKVAQQLKSYQDVLGKERVYALIATFALEAEYYETCSLAFIILEEIDEKYKAIAFSLFSQ